MVSEDLVCGADRRDAVAVHRQRHIVLHPVDRHDRGVGKHDWPARAGLRVKGASLEEQGRCA
jgi:hypothetical protein